MSCPRFEERSPHLWCCGAAEETTIPTIHQRELHCSTAENFMQCIMLQTSLRLGRELSQREYDELLFAPGEGSGGLAAGLHHRASPAASREDLVVTGPEQPSEAGRC